jgi:ACT domain
MATMTFARLRIELPDHPGALAAVGRVLAGCGLNVVEVAIHEVEGSRAVDEIVVHGDPPDYALLAPALAAVGTDLLSVAPCEMRGDPVVTALTWVTATLDGPARRSALATGLRTLTGLENVYVARIEEAMQWPIAAAAVNQRQVVVQRLALAPEPLRTAPDRDGSGAWVLAAPDGGDPAFVVIAARPYSIRFTATEINRLAAVLDCRRRLAATVVQRSETTLVS